MPNLEYRTEDQRVGDGVASQMHPYTSGDPFHPRTERERVAEAELSVDYPATSGLLRDPATNHLVGIEQAPYVPHARVGDEYPKWITPHESQVHIAHPTGYRQERGDFETEEALDETNDTKDAGLETKDDNLIVPRGAVVSVPGFEHHVRRHDRAISVLVHNEDEEKRALGEYQEAEPAVHVPLSERLEAERIYQSERGSEESEKREARIAEIINERRKANLELAEKELEAKRQQAEIQPRDVGRRVDVPEHTVESPMGVPLSGVADRPSHSPEQRANEENTDPTKTGPEKPVFTR